MAKVTLECGDRFIADKKKIAGFDLTMTIQNGRRSRTTILWVDYGDYTIPIQTLRGSGAGQGVWERLTTGNILAVVKGGIEKSMILAPQEKIKAVQQAEKTAEQLANNKPVLKK